MTQRKMHAPWLLRLEALLWAGALLCGGIYGYYWLDRTLAQRQYAREQPVVTEPVPLRKTPTILPEGSLIGRIEIPQASSVAVLEGVGETTLDRGVGHIPGTALPGETGRVALAAHRDTFFRPLKDTRPGDRIRLSSSMGEFTYTVSHTEIVDPDQPGVLAPSTEPLLTLITCYPFNYIGSAPQRFIVHARLEREVSLETSPQAAPEEAPVKKKPVVKRRAKPVEQVEPAAEEDDSSVQPGADQASADQPAKTPNRVARAVTAPFRKAFGWMRR